MLFRFITFLFVIWILSRLLFRYILPIFRFTAVTGNRMRQMQDQMREMDQKMNNNTAKPKVQKEGDYIDYEEVK